MPESTIELNAGLLRLALRPDLGGSIAGLWHAGEPVLRSSDPGTLAGPRAGACFPLLPYSNRLGYRRFRWLGKEHTTEPNFDDSPHSLHGVGWRRAWQVDSRTDTRAVLMLRHAGDADWPFAFTATQSFVLEEDREGGGAGTLTSALVLVNDAPHAAPAGLGWHPYFPKRTRSRIHIELTDRWESDPATQLPTRRVPQPGIDGDVAHLRFDHCFEGWQGAARARDECFTVALTSSLPYLVVFTPEQREHYCIEPVSHLSNAIHMADPAAHGLKTLQPGERMEAWMKLALSPR